MLDGNNKNITKRTIKPLVSPNKTPRNLSKPEAPDHLISVPMNFITIPPRMMQTIKTTMYERILDTSSLPMYSLILGVAKYSRLTAAIKATTHKNNDKNSLVNPLAKDIKPDAVKTTKINQSVIFRPRASN